MTGHSCCTPGRTSHRETEPGVQTESIAGSLQTGDMRSLAGGRFLMGTDYPFGFPADGEGPVRTVELSPFRIDRYPVTNAQFDEFTKATGYRTDAERFGWSFVFWMHLPADRLDVLVANTVAAAPWCARFRVRIGIIRKGRAPRFRTVRNIPSFTFHGMMLTLLRIGQGSRFRPKRDGSSQRVAAWSRNFIPGVTN
jgi:formylglycine-generating enzyme required for sulfatase activity